MKVRPIKTIRYTTRLALILLMFLGALGLGYVFQGVMPTQFKILGWEIVEPLGWLQRAFATGSLMPSLLVGALFFIVGSIFFGRFFCGWMCPVGLVNEAIHSYRGRMKRSKEEMKMNGGHCKTSCNNNCQANGGLPGAAPWVPPATDEKAKFPSSLWRSKGRLPIPGYFKYVFLAAVLGVSALVGYPVFCIVCPIGIVGRTILGVTTGYKAQSLLGIPGFAWFGAEMIVITLSVFIFEIALSRWSEGSVWCGKLCPMGALFSLLGNLNPLKRISLRVHRKKICESPICVIVCPTGAASRDVETGMITTDWDLCTGCKNCVIACPFGSRSVDFENRDIKAELCEMEPICFEYDPKIPTRRAS